MAPEVTDSPDSLELVDVNDLQRAVERGASVVRDPWSESDESGTVRMATIRTYGQVTHTFVDRSQYKGWFMPGYKRMNNSNDPVFSKL